MSEATGLQIDLLKPHVQAILDEIHRAGFDAIKAATDGPRILATRDSAPGYESGSAESADAPTAGMSCSALLVLSAVAEQIYHDMGGGLDALPYLLDAADYYLSAVDAGCV
jgi:hypothetical protein